MAGPDLRGARRAAEALLVDQVRITRDTDGLVDGAIDPDTLERLPAVDDDALVYDGPCMVTAADADAVEAGPTAPTGETAPDRWNLQLPLDAPPVARGMVAELLVATWDPQLAGRRFRLTDRGGVATFAVLRLVPMVALTAGG